MFDSLNVFGKPLKACCHEPKTGFYRDGFCNTADEDQGMHIVCIEVTQKFLDFSKSKGNDLSTPNAAFGFPGLKEGDRWCLCAARWVEAYQNESAPKVFLESTHIETLGIIPLELLKEFQTKSNV